MVRWRKPIVLDTSVLDRSLGTCETGATPFLQSCGDGHSTGHETHGCQNGGVAGIDGGCSMGETPDTD